MKTNHKRLVGILLCLAMVLAMLPLAVSAADTVTVYYYNATNWSTVNVYWWGSADTNPEWPGVTMTDLGNGYWTYDVPADIAGKEGIIFNNGSAQTSNLTLPTDGKNCFNGTEWITYTGEDLDIQLDYYLRGDMNGWEATDANKMTEQADGTYKITMALTAGTYEYKAALADWSWSCPAGDNATVTIESDCDVTFVLDVANNTVTATADSVVEPEPVPEVYYLRGDMNGWDTSAPMTDNGDGTWSITMDLEVGTYEYKAGLEDWSVAYPADANATVIVSSACAVTFVLNLNDGTVTATGAGVGEPEPVVVEKYVIAGSAGLCGAEWDYTVEAGNTMTAGADGIYRITYTNIGAGAYEFKIVAINSDDTVTWIGDSEGNNFSFEVEYLAEMVEIEYDPATGDYGIAIVEAEQPTEPEPTEPEPTEPEPTEPEPTEPEPTEPEPTEPEPTEPEPTEPEPTDPEEPTEPEIPSEDEDLPCIVKLWIKWWKFYIYMVNKYVSYWCMPIAE
ncbi:MAG: starch-binding protein [Oscillospiraceae bacterium]|nr:starch-binding protein [Oscillospiraceae bacterium]